jgi:nucleotide-binding universal stress UspA family protein
LIDELLLDGSDSLFDIEVEVEVADEDPVGALIGAARNHDAQGIVIGNEQRSSLRSAVGTVTTELLNRSPVPVIAVPLTSVPPASRSDARAAS